MQLVRYQYTNNLGTATLELANNAAIISYEEYYPGVYPDTSEAALASRVGVQPPR